jgi:hypothetical protein
MWEAIVFTKYLHSKWHAQDCMFGTCGNYGVDNLALCLDEEDGTSPIVVCWKCFNMEKVLNKKGEEKKKLKLLDMQINST